MRKYGFIVIWFIIQNFIVFMYPTLINDILNLYSNFNKNYRKGPFPIFYLKEFEILNRDDYLVFDIISNIILGIITIILILNKKLQIEAKFAYFCLTSVFISLFAFRVLIILFPFTLLVFIPFLQRKDNFIEFVKNNKIIVLGLLSIIVLSFMPTYNFTFYKYVPKLEEYPYYIIVNFRWLFFVSSLGISIIIIHLREFKVKSKLELSNNS